MSTGKMPKKKKFITDIKSRNNMDPAQLKEVQEWMESTLGTKLPNFDMAKDLKTGIVLCNLANKLQPGIIAKISTGKMPFMYMENIGKFVDAASKLGVESNYNFVTVDLFEEKNLKQVLLCLYTLKRKFSGVTTTKTGNNSVFDKYL
eukprot:TRINITY_DN7737_c0_g1_i1.p1 TRINITY_DN7737_c0_g1~~TRINITY_DN7737_c0_g1_i1.p1  ORF type:complete len:147 (+),score=38.68 TRINITY_DN7737_c0_g1_i1:69-509(+)